MKFNVDTPNNFNLSVFCEGQVCTGVKHSDLLPVSTMRQVIKIRLAMMEKLAAKMFLLTNTDGGGDRNHRFDRAQTALISLVQELNAEKKTVAGDSAQNLSESFISALINDL